MQSKTKWVIGITGFIALAMVAGSLYQPLGPWKLLLCYLVLGIVSASLKFSLPGGQSALSFNVPYILLSIVWLPLPASLIVAAASALVICTFRVSPPNTPAQVALNITNVINSAGLAWFVYHFVLAHSGQPLPALVLAALGYFVLNSLTVSAVLATFQERSLFTIWRLFAWSLPYYAVGAVLAAGARYVELRFGRLTAQMVLPLVYITYCMGRNYAGRLRERAKHAADMADLHLRTIETLAIAIEAKDQNTHDHLCRVKVYAAGIGAALQLTPDETKALMAAALLHDIGKLAVPEYIINKPGKLTPDEFEKMKIHPIVGAEILDRVSFPYPVSPIVRAHHEQWTGGGYPDGLVGEAIPIGARILSVVDCFDALASDRPYRKALSLSDAISHIQKYAGTHFEPRIVDILVERYEELEIAARLESGKMKPLDTEIIVRRGIAPSAGFAVTTPLPVEPSSDSPTSAEGESGHSKLVTDIRDILTSHGTASSSLSLLSAQLKSTIAFDMMMIFRRSGEVLTLYYLNDEGATTIPTVELPIGEGLCGWVAKSRQSIVNGNALVEVGLTNVYPRMLEMRSALALPLSGASDALCGVVALYKAASDSFGPHDLNCLQSIQPLLTSFLEREVTIAAEGLEPSSCDLELAKCS